MNGKNVWKFFKTPIIDHLRNPWNNLHDFFTSPSRSRWYAIAGIIILVIALPVTVIVLQQQTNIRQHAMVEGGGGGCSSAGQSCGVNSDCCDGGNSTYCDRKGICRNYCNVSYGKTCNGQYQCDATFNANRICGATDTYNCALHPGVCGYNPSNKCAGGAGTCYINNSCGSGSHQVDNGGCATGYRICCVPNPVTPTPTPFINTCLQTAGNKCAPANQGCDTLGAYTETTGACDIYHRSACCRPKSCEVGYTWNDSQHKCVPTSCTAAGDKCYVNNSCGAGQHEVTDSSHSCTSTDNAGRICCAAGPVVCDTIGQVCCPGSVCSNGLYCDPINVTCQADKGYECANDGDRGAGKNEIVDGGTRISFTPKKYCSTNYFCTVNHNLVTSHQAANGKWYSTSDTDICQPVYDASHPYPGDTCASVNGPGVCLMATNSYPYYNTYRDATCLIPGPQVCDVRPVPDCAEVLPGTATNRVKETQACPWNGGHDYKCCVYTSGITCSKIIAGGVCPIALTGKICPDGYHDSGASHPNSFCPIGGHSCCVPDTSTTPTTTPTPTTGGGGGGGGGGCTNGQTTGFALSLKLDGIGNGQFENSDPKHPNRTGHVRVFNTADPSRNIHGSSQALNHGKDSGKFDSAKIDLGAALQCDATYKVEVKLPGYLPASSEVKYGDTNQTISLEPLPGDINKVDLSTKEIVGDGKIWIEDYSIYRQCLNQDPTTPIPFKSDTQTVQVACGDLINFFDFQDGGTMESVTTPSGVGEWDANYNLWLRSYVKANGF